MFGFEIVSPFTYQSANWIFSIISSPSSLHPFDTYFNFNRNKFHQTVKHRRFNGMSFDVFGYMYPIDLKKIDRWNGLKHLSRLQIVWGFSQIQFNMLMMMINNQRTVKWECECIAVSSFTFEMRGNANWSVSLTSDICKCQATNTYHLHVVLSIGKQPITPKWNRKIREKTLGKGETETEKNRRRKIMKIAKTTNICVFTILVAI